MRPLYRLFWALLGWSGGSFFSVVPPCLITGCGCCAVPGAGIDFLARDGVVCSPCPVKVADRIPPVARRISTPARHRPPTALRSPCWQSPVLGMSGPGSPPSMLPVPGWARFPPAVLSLTAADFRCSAALVCFVLVCLVVTAVPVATSPQEYFRLSLLVFFSMFSASERGTVSARPGGVL